MSAKSTLSENTNAINQSGSFLQSHIKYQLKKAGWSVDSEFPVQSAPFIGDPLTNQIHFTRAGLPTFEPANLIKSMSDSQNNLELEETSIDVIGVAENDGDPKLTFKLCIECKKLDPTYSDWIFLDAKYKRTMNLITKDITSKGFVSLFKIPGTTKHGNEIHVELNRFDTWAPFSHAFSDTSIAISNRKIDKKTYDTKKSLIDNASRQIIEGTFGFILNDLQHQILTGEGYEHRIVVYVPIVVTTANLKICDADPADIDLATGYITKEPSYRTVDSILYECGAPKSVRFPHPQFTHLSAEHKRNVQKWHVLILSPKGFINFIKSLRETDLLPYTII